MKDTVKAILKANLVEMGVLGTEGVEQPVSSVKDSPVTATAVLSLTSLSSTGFTFEQQKELLILQLAHEKSKQQAEIDKQIAVENLRHQTELAKLNALYMHLCLALGCCLFLPLGAGRWRFN